MKTSAIASTIPHEPNNKTMGEPVLLSAFNCFHQYDIYIIYLIIGSRLIHLLTLSFNFDVRD
ncbi:hypothetical protein Patl1_36399 [Pistacia atlantica]|nr:hypothetical protein Patl1_36399 [Pistacia atlantica]